MIFQYIYACLCNTANPGILSKFVSVPGATQDKIIPGDEKLKSIFRKFSKIFTMQLAAKWNA